VVFYLRGAHEQYQQEQQEYYENYYGNENYQQQYGQGNYQYQWDQMTGTYDVNQCKWWQVNCFPYYINENGEPQPSAGWVCSGENGQHWFIQVELCRVNAVFTFF